MRGVVTAELAGMRDSVGEMEAKVQGEVDPAPCTLNPKPQTLNPEP